MKVSLSMICFLVGLSMMSLTGGIACGQEERGELPEGIRQLIHAAEQAEQRVKQEGAAASEETQRAERKATAAVRKAVSDYYSARFEYQRAGEANEKAQAAAEVADKELLKIQSEALPNPPANKPLERTAMQSCRRCGHRNALGKVSRGV